MEDHRLKAFCLIVEMRSFSKAAGAKFMTQSAMSHLIKNLEEELGIRLLIRKGKTVIPTPAGKVLYDHAKKIINQYQNIENDIHALMHEVKGTLILGASTTVALYLLPQVFYNFSNSYPEVQIELSVSNTETVIDNLFGGNLDTGIVEGKIKNSNVYLEDFAEDEIVVITSENNPLAKKQALTAHDLLSQPFIMPEAGSGIREFIDDFLRMNRIDIKNLKINMTLGSPELIVQMVQSGIGISFVSKWSVFKAIKEGSIKLLHISDKKLKRKFYLVSIEKDPRTTVVKTFWDFIRGFRFFMPF